MPYQPIACHQHDYIEIACLKAYQIRLHLVSGNFIEGTAKTTLSYDQQEFLLLEGNQGEHKVRLDQIKKITVLTMNADFNSIQLIETD